MLRITQREGQNGLVYAGDDAFAAYLVHWTPGEPDHDANLDLVLGRWGDGASPDARVAVSVMHRAGGGFMVVNADERPWVGEGAALFSRALRRDEVIGSTLAQEVFRVLDAIWLDEFRIDELRARR